MQSLLSLLNIQRVLKAQSMISLHCVKHIDSPECAGGARRLQSDSCVI